MHILKKTFYHALVILPLLLGSGGQAHGEPDDLTETYKNLELFSNILSIVQQNYVDEIDSSEAIEGAIQGLLISLDPHSSYLDPEVYKEIIP